MSLLEAQMRKQMDQYETFSIVCLFIFAIIASISIMNLSYTGAIASLLWLILAAIFQRLKNKVSWSRQTF